MDMRPDDQELAKINMKPEVEELLCSWDFLNHSDYPDGVAEVRGGPLLEIISVHVRPNIDPGDDDAKADWKIIATISAGPPTGAFSVLFLPRDSPAIISNLDSNDFAPLPGLESGPIMSFFPTFHAQVYAKDLLRDRELVDEPFLLKYEDFKEFDRVQYSYIDGRHGTLRLKHITYRAALVTTVSVKISRSVVDGATGDQVMVCGTIIGSCHYDISHISVHPPFDEPDSACITLFDSSHQVPVTLGQHMDLPLPAIAVPSYSYLALHINLNIAGFGSVEKIAIFKGAHNSARTDTIEGPQGLVLQVSVKLNHECLTIAPMDAEVTDDKEVQASSTEVTGDQEGQPSFFFLYKYRQPVQFKGDTLMEVFSTFIALKNDEPCKIHGRIEVFDALRESFCIYDHDDSNAEEISGNNRTLSLQGPHDNSFAFDWNELGMKIDLKAGDRQFCKGVIWWSVIAIREPWLDNHMCSVIKGDLGYAAVYYGIFKNAVQAKLRVFFLSSSVETYVSGSIFGEHGDFDYTTHFEKECYRSVLFSRAQETAEVLSAVDDIAMPLSPDCYESERSKLLKVSGVELSLFKSVVLVPKDTSLVLEVDLLAKTCIDGSNVEVGFKNRVEFEAGCQTCWVSSNKNCEICVFVDWDTVFKRRIREHC